jgi:SAM-dependent methyltransferase
VEFPNYAIWREIDYRPAVAEMLPHALLPHLNGGETVLDVGCNAGGAALYLAQNRFNVVGIDINASAIRTARARAAERELTNVRFTVADLFDATLPRFDAVIGLRLLTCFPDASERGYALARMDQALRPGGLIYLEDFMVTPQSATYAHRYAQGDEEGLGEGNFAVPDASGQFLFVAHHHSDGEVERMTRPYTALHRKSFQGLSMNGNLVNMFEFVGRKPGQGGMNE